MSDPIKAVLSVLLWLLALGGIPQLLVPQSSAAGLLTLAILIGFAYAGYRLWPYKSGGKK